MIKLLVQVNCIDSAKKIWWDIRPHPDFPTLEFRVMDLPMRLDETIAIAALIQATVAKHWKLYSQKQGFRLYRVWPRRQAHRFRQEHRSPVRELISEYLV